MTITFPHMGQVYIPVKALFDDLGAGCGSSSGKQ